MIPADLLNGYLDGLLTDAEVAELNKWLQVSPENITQFVELARLHDRLRGLIHVPEVFTNSIGPAKRHPLSHTKKNIPRRLWPISICTIAGLIIVVLLVVYWPSQPTGLNAAEELNHLIDKATVLSDRRYVIRNLDDQPEVSDERRPPIDGALLYVRHPEQYVLIRKYPDGRAFVTGCDGEHSWAIPPSGAVRVSSDVLRFRGPVPGHQHGIPFVNLRSDLVQLRDAYEVSALGSGANGQRGLLALKKSPEYRGPNRVELWYDPTTGVIHRMVFGGMPKARGGPDRVAVELQEQRELRNDFFHHQAHHTADRRVVEED